MCCNGHHLTNNLLVLLNIEHHYHLVYLFNSEIGKEQIFAVHYGICNDKYSLFEHALVIVLPFITR